MRTGRQVSRLLNISGAAAEQEDTGAKPTAKARRIIDIYFLSNLDLLRLAQTQCSCRLNRPYEELSFFLTIVVQCC